MSADLFLQAFSGGYYTHAVDQPGEDYESPLASCADAGRAIVHTTKIRATDCDDCGVPMEIKGHEYVCDMCGFTRAGADHIIGQGKAAASVVTLISGGGKIQTFNASGPVEKSRADTLEGYLMLKQADYAARNDGKLAFPLTIIGAVAARYADIQQQHEARGLGPFIHRGEVRKRFISALLRDECGIQRYPLKSEIIAEFMQLNSTGFSDGETIMQHLVTMGLTTICDPCPPVGFAERYLDFLQIRTAENVQFVVEIVEVSKLIHLCMSSHMPSKIVGAIRLLIVSLGRDDITPEMIEQATERTKVNTYMKFYNSVVERLPMFIHVFENNGIPYPIIKPPKKTVKRM
jgi:predicted RNA-binding Zn-ribbon protein involved in translation (DUF1610 family)